MKDIIEEAKNPKYISGIYNYCDRWCERCPFTAKCLNYSSSEEYFDTPEKKDINNKEFWDAMGKVYADTLKMITEKSKEMGIDLNFTPEQLKEYEAKEERQRKNANNNIIPKMAKKYYKMEIGRASCRERV